MLFDVDIAEQAQRNSFFREVLTTGKHSQVPPPQHVPGTIHRTKADADAAEADHAGATG